MPVRDRQRLGPTDWIEAALSAIAGGGLAAVSIERLAGQLGVTKGSFYAHFATRDELIEAALGAWEANHGGSALTGIEQIADPAERLAAVLHLAIEFSQSTAPSVHVSLLGEMGDPRVRAAVSRVSRARMERLSATYVELGFTPERSAQRARMLYASYLGLLQLAREGKRTGLGREQTESFIAELSRVMIDP